MLPSVEKAQSKANEIAGLISQVQDQDNMMALFFLRVNRKQRDDNVQALRDMVAKEIREQRQFLKNAHPTMQFIGEQAPC